MPQRYVALPSGTAGAHITAYTYTHGAILYTFVDTFFHRLLRLHPEQKENKEPYVRCTHIVVVYQAGVCPVDEGMTSRGSGVPEEVNNTCDARNTPVVSNPIHVFRLQLCAAELPNSSTNNAMCV